MPIDPNIPLAAGNIGLDVGKLANMAQFAQQMRVAKQQEQSQNALRTIFAQPDAIDPATGAISQNTLNRVMQVDPQTGIKLHEQAVADQMKAAQAKHYETEAGALSFDKMTGIAGAAYDAYTDAKAHGASEDDAIHKATIARNTLAKNSAGLMSDKDVEALVNSPFEPDTAKAFAGLNKEWGATKRADKSEADRITVAKIAAGYGDGSDTGTEPAAAPIKLADATAAISKLVPGAVITSGKRTPEKNASVGGVPDSMHLDGDAIDFVLPKGAKPEEIKKAIQDAGLPVTEFLVEKAGDKNSTGDHVHWGWRPKEPQGNNFPTRGGKGWQVLTDPSNKDANGNPIQYRYNPNTSVSTTLSGEPYTPGGAQKLGGGSIGGRSAASIAVNKYVQEHPNATAEDIQQFAADTAKIVKGVSAFGTGKQGDTVKSLNVAIQHLNLMDQLSGALANGDTQIINKLKNAASEQFGGADVTNFDVAKGIVGDEIVKAVVGGAGALADRENAQNQLNRAKTWKQLLGVTKTARGLMAGQMSGLRTQYEASTGRKDFDHLLSDETKKELGALNPKASAALPTINSSDDYEKLSKGTHYLGPDGKEYVKK